MTPESYRAKLEKERDELARKHSLQWKYPHDRHEDLLAFKDGYSALLDKHMELFERALSLNHFVKLATIATARSTPHVSDELLQATKDFDAFLQRGRDE